MAWIVIPSLLSKRPWARIRARCEASFFIVLSKSIRCCSVRGRTYLTLMDLDLGFTYVLFWSYRENIIPKNFWLGTYMKIVPKHVVGAGVDINVWENIVGSGPFKIKQARRNDSVTFEKNVKYFKP